VDVKLPVNLAVVMGRAALLAGRTWHFDQLAESAARPDPERQPVIYAFWHEHLLPLARLHAAEGANVLVSRHRDGEIISRLLLRLGYTPSRGSSTRGGAAGLREMIRAGKEGGTLAFSPDGPRGPRRRCKPGLLKAAAETELPIVPVGVSATRGWRLNSWDRFMIPSPGARVYVSYGAPIWIRDADEPSLAAGMARIERALNLEVERCERRTTSPSPFRRRIETRVRHAWKGRPGPLLRGAEAVFSTAAETRHLLYDAGVLTGWRASIPVLSVGGLTVGGSGKTPLAAEFARWLAADGRTVAILTRGYADELALHRAMNPRALVMGHQDRRVAALAAARAGATVALLDDGFQHRRLMRDLEIVVLDLDAMRRTNRRRLPAGPFRERIGSLGRAHVIVLAGRDGDRAAGAELAEWIGRRCREADLARCALVPDELVPVNDAAARISMPRPTVALTGIMKPNLFFEQVEQMCPGVSHRHALPDHTAPSNEDMKGTIAEAGSGGLVITGKDVSRISYRIPDSVPLWFLGERVEWISGLAPLRRRLREASLA
jgi:tetraacyldisaccharide-1-P 4'-kinase/lysophospholipid acyltransferase (LPLAT)-like uncharacterized protein